MTLGLDKVKGCGPATLQKFRNQNIWSTYDLLLVLPKKYQVFKLNDTLVQNEDIYIKVNVYEEPKVFKGKKISGIKFKAYFKELLINVTVFQRAYLEEKIQVGMDIYLYGKYEKQTNNFNTQSILFEFMDGTIKPIYDIDGVKDYLVINILNEIIDNKMVDVFELLPDRLVHEKKLLGRYDAYVSLHRPKSMYDIERAKNRLKYEEAYLLQKELHEKALKKEYRKPKPYHIDKVKDLINKLPFELTQSQKTVVNEIFMDFKNDYVSYRLIQGDVGSGKTIVAALGIYGAITAGEQVALMAPTEMLARQHFETLSKILDVRIALLTSQTKNKKDVYEQISYHDVDLVIGTHALIQDKVQFNNLGLIVIDEQHKFGVRTRAEIINKAVDKDVLYLTATPIPRTLALSYFSDTSISIINEKPQDRKPVLTNYVLETDRHIIIEPIKKALEKEEKVYVVVPAIESDNVRYNIQTTYEFLQQYVNKDELYVVHGKLDNKTQEEVIENFIQAKSGILLSTTMIEVGIDVPRATVMVIMDAHHFGLSQLHQLRGRVGRSSLQSYCYLVSNKEDNERLNILTATYDGFILSDYDLKMRGPGSFLGMRQSGHMQFKFLDFVNDFDIIKDAKLAFQKYRLR